MEMRTGPGGTRVASRFKGQRSALIKWKSGPVQVERGSLPVSRVRCKVRNGRNLVKKIMLLTLATAIHCDYIQSVMKKKTLKSYKDTSLMVRMEADQYADVVECANGMHYGVSGYVREVLRVHCQMLRASGPNIQLVEGMEATTWMVVHDAWKRRAMTIAKEAGIQVPGIVDQEREPREGVQNRILKPMKKLTPKRQKPPSGRPRKRKG